MIFSTATQIAHLKVTQLIPLFISTNYHYFYSPPKPTIISQMSKQNNNKNAPAIANYRLSTCLNSRAAATTRRNKKSSIGMRMFMIVKTANVPQRLFKPRLCAEKPVSFRRRCRRRYGSNYRRSSSRFCWWVFKNGRRGERLNWDARGDGVARK